MPSRRTRFPDFCDFQLISCLRSHPPPRPRRWSPRNITYRRDPVGWSPPMIIHRRDPVGDRRGISLTAAAQLLPTELKCKTLGRIHMQALDAGITPHYQCILRMRVRVPRCARVGHCLYLACFTPVAPVASL